MTMGTDNTAATGPAPSRVVTFNGRQVTTDQLVIDTIRTLSIDAVQAANSGHPGAPMALAPLALVLWNRVMNFDPRDPAWPNRDRFLLSNGHASMLLWSVLHLADVAALGPDRKPTGEPAISLADIKQFRQLDSKANGHPEYGVVSGVEATTGPLGQGVAMSVGFAIAERFLAERFNRPGFDVFDHRTYAVCGDGCMMEGVSGEAASLAGHLGLDKLCWIYDSNRITIDGSTDITFTEDVPARFAAYGWNVLHVDDANDLDAIEASLEAFKSTRGKPTFIVLRSHIGFGSPHKQDTAAAHGEALGVDEVKLTKKAYGWPEDAQFLVPDGVHQVFAGGLGARGRDAHAAWQTRFDAYRAAFPNEAAEIDQIEGRTLPADWDRELPTFPADEKGVAGREASGKVLNVLAASIPWLVGGAADLESSTKTALKSAASSSQQAACAGGRNIHFGIREHEMGAAVNGLVLSKVRAFTGTFFVFSDYMRPAMRLAAVMGIPSLFIFTHDALGDGEDGPTHQPIEQLASLRAMPGITVLRPGDANEVVEAYRVAMAIVDRPVVMVLSRQPIATLDRTRYAPATGVAKGAYVIADGGSTTEDAAAAGMPQIILIATGGELGTTVLAHEKLVASGVRSRVVSMPSWDLFAKQSTAYRDSVLPPTVTARVAVEQASTFGWERYVGQKGRVVGMDGFGESAPYAALQKHFGFTVDAVVEAARAAIADNA